MLTFCKQVWSTVYQNGRYGTAVQAVGIEMKSAPLDIFTGYLNTEYFLKKKKSFLLFMLPMTHLVTVFLYIKSHGTLFSWAEMSDGIFHKLVTFFLNAH